MLYKLFMPLVLEGMERGTINFIYAKEGMNLKVGTKLLDFTVDISAAAVHECPPAASYRIIVREPVWLRQLNIAVGDECQPDALIGIFTTLEDESLETLPARSLRIATAGIVLPVNWT